MGNVAARGAIATLQSAGAGGYGVAVVHGILRVGAVALGAAGLMGKDSKGTDGGENTNIGHETDINEEEEMGGEELEQKQKEGAA